MYIQFHINLAITKLREHHNTLLFYSENVMILQCIYNNTVYYNYNIYQKGVKDYNNYLVSFSDCPTIASFSSIPTSHYNIILILPTLSLFNMHVNHDLLYMLHTPTHTWKVCVFVKFESMDEHLSIQLIIRLICRLTFLIYSFFLCIILCKVSVNYN